MSTVVTTGAAATAGEPATESESAASNCALPLGTRLGEFEVERVLGAGGFGIVYLALDHSLGRRVAVKEYVPSSLAVRGKGSMLTLRSAADAPTFAAGLRSFINEARLLASFHHPSLVEVHRFWEENGTAYMAMPYYDGRTLKEVRDTMSGTPDEAWLQGVVQPLLGALDVLHGQHVFHRDISPDNIMLLPDGRPLLLDFGSARRVVGDGSKALTAILKPNFAPVEQYADLASFPQGPWTDLYALGAVVYYLLTNESPMPAALRAMRDELPLLSAPERFSMAAPSQRFLAAIDWAMAVNPEDRPVSVTALRMALNGGIEPSVPSRHTATPLPAAPSPDGFWPVTAVDPPRAASEAAPHDRKRSATRVMAAVATLVLCTAAFGTWTLSRREAAPAVAGAAAAPAPTAVPSAPTMARAAVGAGSVVSAAEPVPAAASPAPVVRARDTTVAALTAKPKASAASVARPKSMPTAAVDSRPLEECAEKNFLLRPLCVRQACEQPQLQMHSRCIELRAQDEARAQSQLNR